MFLPSLDRLNARAPSVLWVFGALVATGTTVGALNRIGFCGLRLVDASCSLRFSQALPHVMWLAYIFVGAASIGLAAYAAWSQRPNSPSAQPRLAWVCAAAALSFALVTIVALAEYYVIAFVLAHLLILRALERGREAPDLLIDISVISVSWVVAMTLAWAEPLSAWPFGISHTQDGQFAIIVFAIALLLNVQILRAPRDGTSRKAKVTAAVLEVLSLAVFMLLSFRQDFFRDPGSLHHWGFFVGPAELVRQGGWLLWDVPSQYGFLSILAIAIMPFTSAWTSMYVLDASLIFASACIFFFALRALRLGRFSIAFSFLSTLVVVYLIPGAYQRLSGPQYYPSVGALRFFWVDSLILIVLMDYALTFAHQRRRVIAMGGSIAWLLGVLWSAESAIYVTVIWIPSLFAMVLRDADGETIVMRLRALARPINLLLLASPALLLAIAVVIIQFTYSLALGHGPDYFAFYEFGLSYGTGFGAYPISAFGSVWWLLFALAVCVASCVLVVTHSIEPNRAFPLLYSASAAIWVTSSYFISRSADSNATNIFTPVWLSIAAILFVLDREQLIGVGERYVRFALVAPLTVAVGLTVGNKASLTTLANDIRGGYTFNVPRLLAQLPPKALAVLDQARVTGSDPMVFEGFTLMPERPGVDAGAKPPLRWLPANPSLLLTVIPARRRLVYFKRFTARRPMDGWYLRAHSATSTCQAFDPQYVTSVSYRTPDWDLSWCTLAR